jgi:flavin reductase (DIM6/NTAB) family NADH-FMN oxidoreductase RutF
LNWQLATAQPSNTLPVNMSCSVKVDSPIKCLVSLTPITEAELTITAFSKQFKDKLGYLGTVSGKDEAKITKSGLTPISSEMVPAPGFEEAELIIECKKIYWDDLKPDNFIDATIEGSYPEKDYHRIYFGEILAIHGVEKYKTISKS